MIAAGGGGSVSSAPFPMTPTPRRAALFTCLVALLVGLAIAVAARQASPARSPEQILKRMQALSEEAKTCSDLARLQQIAQEIQQLGFEYKQAIEGKGGAGVTLPEARKADTAATGQLEGREDDPCYPVLHAGAVTQRLYGTKPKTRCIPAEVRLAWRPGGRRRDVHPRRLHGPGRARPHRPDVEPQERDLPRSAPRRSTDTALRQSRRLRRPRAGETSMASATTSPTTGQSVHWPWNQC